jgi:hypothetical protein
MSTSARKLASAVSGALGALSALWYYRQVALLTSGKQAGSLLIPGLLAATCTMLALYLWESTRLDE